MHKQMCKYVCVSVCVCLRLLRVKNGISIQCACPAVVLVLASRHTHDTRAVILRHYVQMFTVFTLQQKFKWHHTHKHTLSPSDEEQWAQSIIHFHFHFHTHILVRVPVLISCFCFFQFEKEIKPSFYGRFFSVPICVYKCVCECATYTHTLLPC